MYQLTTLPNGLRILTCSMPHTRSVTVSFFVGAGSRYESDAEAGISHYVEHMLFKGTTRRPTPKEVSEVVEGVGGTINASTDREMTIYWAKVARPHFPQTLDLLMDVLRNSLFDPEEIEKERAVILEELNAVADSPADLVEVLLDEAMWPGQPLGRDIAGSRQSVSGITRDMLLRYVQRQYLPNNLVLSVAGNVEHQEVVDQAAAALGDLAQGTPDPWQPAVLVEGAPRVKVARRKTEQAHLCVAAPGLSHTDPDRETLDMVNVVLGDGMTSRLFLNIRERLGLAYDVHSYTTHLLDTGMVTVYAGVDPKRVDAALGAVLDELSQMQDGLTAEELHKAKELTKGRLLLRMEDTRAVSSWMGGQELLTGRVLTPDEVVEKIDAVTEEGTRRVAARLFRPERLTLALVGPYTSEKRFQKLLRG